MIGLTESPFSSVSSNVTAAPVIGGPTAAHHPTLSPKSTEDTHTPQRRIKPQDLYWLHLPLHTERMIRTCFALAEKPAYRELLLARWAHMLGYRGHATTKSRNYSTTYGQIRGDRRAYREAERRERDGQADWDGREIVIDAEWRFVRSGLVHGEDVIVENIRLRQGISSWIRDRDSGDAA